MGEYTEEAIQNGLCEDYAGRKEQSFGSQYNNEVWQDVTGKCRRICNMDSLHLCFVVNYILSGYCKVKGKRLERMCYTLQSRLYTISEFKDDLENLQLGVYMMYPKESGKVESYYINLLRKYPDYDWSNLVDFMYW